MDKSEKCYYAVIGNNKRGKFYGAGPIQVAKKVASKKLKTGKEMEFYLDEVAGKKKRIGPYQARKDKKSGRVAVVKGRKVMRGGLTADLLSDLQDAFSNNCKVILNEGQTLQHPIKIVDISVGIIKTKPFIFFNFEKTNETNNKKNGNIWKYKYAVFEDENGTLFLFFENSNEQIMYCNFLDAFISIDSNSKKNNLMKKESITKLNILINRINGNNRKNSPIIKRICEKAVELKTFLESNKKSNSKIIYYTGESKKIQKCVYSDLTFGILDEKSEYNKAIILECYSNYQIFLIMKKSLFGGFEPVIFLRKPIEGQSISNIYNFDVFIYEKDGQFYIIQTNNTDTSYGFSIVSITFLKKNITELKYYCETLQKIPQEFGRFRRLREISAGILENINQSISTEQSQRNTPPPL